MQMRWTTETISSMFLTLYAWICRTPWFTLVKSEFIAWQIPPPLRNIYGRGARYHSSRHVLWTAAFIVVALVQKGGEANATSNPMASTFRNSRMLGVLEHLGSAPLRRTIMLLHWLDLDMVSGLRHWRRRCGTGGGDPYRSRRWVKFRATGGSGGRILKKGRRPNIGRIGWEAAMATTTTH